MQELEDAPDKVLDDDDMVDLSHKGTEHFKTRKASKLIKVFYSEQPFELAKGAYTTEQLIASRAKKKVHHCAETSLGVG